MAEKGLRLEIARSFWDFDRNRRIRNECRAYLTNDTSHIGPIREFSFWLRCRVDWHFILYVGYNEQNKDIAYGLIKYDEHLRPWLSGGIREAYRGQGYGFLLFSGLCEYAPSPCYLEVLESNSRAYNLYGKLGFREMSSHLRNGKMIITMERGTYK